MDELRPAPRVLALIAPMTQLNTPYPSTAYLTGFLRSRNVDARQEDIAIQLVLRLLSRRGLAQIKAELDAQTAAAKADFAPPVQHFLDHYAVYSNTIDATIRFLQGCDSTLAHRINSRQFLPEGGRFYSLDEYADPTSDDAFDDGADPLGWAFGSLGAQDRARHLATLYLNDIADVIQAGIDARFAFVRYGESLASSQGSFEPLALALAAPLNLIDQTMLAILAEVMQRHNPSVVLLSVPFPGTVYAALRMGQWLKQHYPTVSVSMGGGYVNTELRTLSEPRLFDYVDYITLDAGEAPVMALLQHLAGQRPRLNLLRTFCRVDGAVRYFNHTEADVPFAEVGTPTWDGLPIKQYLSLLDMLNPMHRLWSDGRWNKLTVAHGCYWKACSFCDVSLDYIARYDAADANLIVDRMQTIITETGQTGFHLVDEAAPPKVLKAMAEVLRERQVAVSWWGNIRFEKTFTPQLCQQLADSGCIAVSGGLEVASDRLLKLMQKGVSVAQVARVTKGFSDAGVLVHAYLMYGFPTQTVQDTVDALEYVRQLFMAGCIQSGFWHRFTCTVHSPVGQNPQAYGITLQPPPFDGFAQNDVPFTDTTSVDHAALGADLNKALYNFMHGVGLERNVRSWFSQPVPKPKVAKDFIEQALAGKIA